MKLIENMNKRDKSIVFSVIAVMIIVLIYLTVILIFSDNRKDMTKIETITFENCIIEIDENRKLKWDKSEEKAIIPIELIYVIGTDKEFDIKIYNQEKKILEAQLIEEKTEEDGTGSDVFVTDYRVEFDMPKDTYYINFVVNKDGISQEMSIDYRYFKEI